MTEYIVGSGVTSTLTLSSGDLEMVLQGGTALNGGVGSGASLIDEGTVNGTQISAAGSLRVDFQAVASGIVAGGAEVLVSSGIYQNETFVSVSAGGTLSSATIGRGGNLNLLGTSFSSFVYSGGYAGVGPGAVASGTTISGTAVASSTAIGNYTTYSTEEVTSGGQTFATVVSGNGVLEVDQGGTDSGATISGGAGTRGTAFANEYVSAGGSATATHVGSAGALNVDGGTAVGTVVSGGGFVQVGTGGALSGATLSGAAGKLADAVVYDGGFASGTIIGAHATLNVVGSATATTVGSGGFLTVSSGGAATGAVINAGGTETFEDVGSGSVTTFGLGAVLDLPFLVYSGGLSGTVDSSDVLTVLQGGDTFVLQLAGSYVGEKFDAVQDSGGGTYVTVACYCPGTRILTPRGEIAVEELQIGDLVVTADRKIEPVRWIGRRSYAGRFLAGKAHLLPVLIRAGALGNGLPRRDLRVSPCHAMLVDGLLVPAGMLVNGLSIVQERDCPRVDYIHLELARHTVVYAEGAPSETFIDDDSRFVFHNATEFAVLYPDSPATQAVFCAPRMTDGFALEAIRDRLSRLAGKLAA